jgi:hypothetical protein
MLPDCGIVQKDLPVSMELKVMLPGPEPALSDRRSSATASRPSGDECRGHTSRSPSDYGNGRITAVAKPVRTAVPAEVEVRK